MSHPTRWIEEVLTGRVLSPADDEALRAHLRSCEACRAEYDRGLEVLRAARGGLAPGELERAASRALRLVKPVPASPSIFDWRPLVAGLSLVAAALAVIVLWPRAQVGVVLQAGKGLVVDGAPAQRDTVLLSRAVVSTEKDDSALLLRDGETKRGVLLRASTQVKVVSASELELSSGRVRLQVKDAKAPLVVRTEAVRVVQDTAGVFIVEERPSGTLIAVHQGKVMVRGGGESTEVGEGQEVEFASNALGTPKAAAANSLVEDRGDGTVWGAILRFLRQLVDVIARALSGD